MTVSPPAVTIRNAEVGDAGALARLLHDGALVAKEDPSDPAPYAAALAEIAATPGNLVLVATIDGEVVGMCQLLFFRHLQERGGRCGEIESAHVSPAVRSEGVGSALVAAAVEAARAAGCYRVQLTSNQARTDAHRFWARQGFEPTHVGFKRRLD